MLLRALVTLVDLRRIWNQCLPILPKQLQQLRAYSLHHTKGSLNQFEWVYVKRKRIMEGGAKSEEFYQKHQ